MITANSGPYLGFGVTTNSTNGLTGTVQDYNGQRGPSLFDLGYGMADPRAAYNYKPGAGVTYKVLGFYDGKGSVDFVPGTVGTSAITVSSAQTPTANTALNLASSNFAGYIANTTIVAPESGTTTGTLVCIGSTATTISFGSDGTVAYWNPAGATSRAITLTVSSTNDGGTFSIAGRDQYGYKVTETITATASVGEFSSAGLAGSLLAATSKKTYKYISSIVAATTIVSTGIGVGVADKYGFPLLVSEAGPANLSLAVSTGAGGGQMLASVTASTATVVFGSTVATATSTTPDARGTWTSSVASSTASSLRLQMVVQPTVDQLNSVTAADMSTIFGVTQYSSV